MAATKIVSLMRHVVLCLSVTMLSTYIYILTKKN